jgi:hypothetical protein
MDNQDTRISTRKKSAEAQEVLRFLHLNTIKRNRPTELKKRRLAIEFDYSAVREMACAL